MNFGVIPAVHSPAYKSISWPVVGIHLSLTPLQPCALSCSRAQRGKGGLLRCRADWWNPGAFGEFFRILELPTGWLLALFCHCFWVSLLCCEPGTAVVALRNARSLQTEASLSTPSLHSSLPSACLLYLLLSFPASSPCLVSSALPPATDGGWVARGQLSHPLGIQVPGLGLAFMDLQNGAHCHLHCPVLSLPQVGAGRTHLHDPGGWSPPRCTCAPAAPPQAVSNQPFGQTLWTRLGANLAIF